LEDKFQDFKAKINILKNSGKRGTLLAGKLAFSEKISLIFRSGPWAVHDEREHPV